MPTVLGASASWNPQCLSRPVKGLLYLYLYLLFFCRYSYSSLQNFLPNFCTRFWSLSCIPKPFNVFHTTLSLSRSSHFAKPTTREKSRTIKIHKLLSANYSTAESFPYIIIHYYRSMSITSMPSSMNSFHCPLS